MRETYMKYIVALVAIVSIVVLDALAIIVLGIDGQLLLSVIAVIGGIAGWSYAQKSKLPIAELTKPVSSVVTYLMPDYVNCPGCNTRYTKEQMGITGALSGHEADVTCDGCGLTFGRGRDQLGLGG